MGKNGNATCEVLNKDLAKAVRRVSKAAAGVIRRAPVSVYETYFSPDGWTYVRRLLADAGVSTYERIAVYKILKDAQTNGPEALKQYASGKLRFDRQELKPEPLSIRTGRDHSRLV